jgi:hypothetical protein
MLEIDSSAVKSVKHELIFAVLKKTKKTIIVLPCLTWRWQREPAFRVGVIKVLHDETILGNVGEGLAYMYF